ncbi:MAG: hypothetical protein HC802_05030 [Caldilineaceae bacterium]|nr:hypothetical protein [Caldilineaceae bacterium]
MSHSRSKTESATYTFFVLGLRQQTDRPGPVRWRLSLENTQTGERVGFVTLPQLIVHLQSWMEEQEENSEV